MLALSVTRECLEHPSCITESLINASMFMKAFFKVGYDSNENPLENSEKIEYVGLSLMYPIIKKNSTLPRKFKKKMPLRF